MKYYIDDINYQIKNNPQKFIAFCESEYNDQLRKIAESIAENSVAAPVVLMSGPSGSGKTTTAHKLENWLDDMGFETHTISLDNYFSPLSEEEQELAKSGVMDLESPARLDSKYLNMQLSDILEKKPVKIPRYNFVTCQREFSGFTLTRKDDEIILFEGTHTLNPEVITIPDEKCARIYTSIRTQFVSDTDMLRSKTIRLARRILRDTRTRGSDPHNTLNMFENVNKGEDVFIRPFMGRCNYSINTTIPYEINIYRTLLTDILDTLPHTEDVALLKRVISKSQPLDPALVPENSLIREFIGGLML